MQTKTSKGLEPLGRGSEPPSGRGLNPLVPGGLHPLFAGGLNPLVANRTVRGGKRKKSTNDEGARYGIG